MLKVTKLRYVDNYNVWLCFDDGTNGIVDLQNHLKGPMFEPLKDLSFFKKVFIDPELSTIAWPNGVDIAPEFLKDNIH